MTQPTDSTPEQTMTTLGDADAAVRTVLEDYRTSGDEVLNLGMVTDEELYAYSHDIAEVVPLGMWFTQLDEPARQAAALGAIRARAVRGQVGGDLGLAEVSGELDADDNASFALETPITAAITLRRKEVHLSLRVIGAVGETWYLLRPIEGDIWLREAVSPHGFHLLSLVRLGESERAAFVGRFQLPDGAEALEAPDVSARYTEAELTAASERGELRFLESVSIIGNLSRFPGAGEQSDDAEVQMINVREDGRIVIGDVAAGAVSYRGATVADLETEWDAWAARAGASEEKPTGG